jgi:lysophospholipase L1-like esterase
MAVVAAAVVSFALTGRAATAPVSEKVASSYSTAAPTLTTPPALPNVAFLGDSYIAGSSMDAGIQFADLITAQKDWNQIMLGEGGSGYVTPGNKGTTFGQRVQTVIDAKPAMVIVSGGFNDKDLAALPAAVVDTLSRLRAGLPGVPIVVLSNFVPGGTPTAAQVQKRDIIKAAASEVGVTFIDVTDVLTPGANFVGTDKVHPTPQGHQHIADVLMPLLPALKV